MIFSQFLFSIKSWNYSAALIVVASQRCLRKELILRKLVLYFIHLLYNSVASCSSLYVYIREHCTYALSIFLSAKAQKNRFIQASLFVIVIIRRGVFKKEEAIFRVCLIKRKAPDLQIIAYWENCLLKQVVTKQIYVFDLK